MIYKENLQYVVIGKSSYRMPEIRKLKKLILKQCELRGDATLGSSVIIMC